jgi:regulator of replication initiation timing
MSMSNQDDILVKIFNKVTNLEEKMVTKEEFEQRIGQTLQSIDRFVKLHETLDTELVSLRAKYDRLEDRLQKVEAKIGV